MKSDVQFYSCGPLVDRFPIFSKPNSVLVELRDHVLWVGVWIGSSCYILLLEKTGMDETSKVANIVVM